MPVVNIIVQLIIFLVFALTLNFWHLVPLLIVFCLLLVILIWTSNCHFYQLMRKLKWFYIVMLFIYVFSTPGEHIANWPLNSFYPTYEGVQQGCVQVLRIATMLAALSLLITNNTKQSLISGFYYLAKPFKHVGLDAERFAARLWLTLHYIELRRLGTNFTDKVDTIHQRLNAIFLESSDDDVEVSFEKPIFRYLDYVLLLILILIMGYFFGVAK